MHGHITQIAQPVSPCDLKMTGQSLSLIVAWCTQKQTKHNHRHAHTDTTCWCTSQSCYGYRWHSDLGWCMIKVNQLQLQLQDCHFGYHLAVERTQLILFPSALKYGWNREVEGGGRREMFHCGTTNWAYFLCEVWMKYFQNVQLI